MTFLISVAKYTIYFSKIKKNHFLINTITLDLHFFNDETIIIPDPSIHIRYKFMYN